jgi:hypothetical protein
MQHLGVLEAAGLVRSEKIERVRTCSIEPGALGLAERWITVVDFGFNVGLAEFERSTTPGGGNSDRIQADTSKRSPDAGAV